MSSEYIANRLNSSTYESIGIIPNSVAGVPLFTELAITAPKNSLITLCRCYITVQVQDSQNECEIKPFAFNHHKITTH